MQLRNELLARDMGLGVVLEPPLEFGDVALVYRKAGRERVSAVAVEQVGATRERVKQVEAADGAARTLAHAVAIDGNEHDRAAVAVAQPRADDADHALMPALSGEHDHLVLDRVVFAFELRERLLEDFVLGRLAQLVLLAQLGGEVHRTVEVLRQKQLGGEVCLAHAPGGVDARREHEADSRGGQMAVGHAGLREQPLKADVVCVLHAAQPLGDENAVFAHNGHDVRDRAERYKVGVAVEHRVRVARKRTDQLERDAHARETVERVGIPRLLAVDDRFGLGQVVVALVVVGDNDLHAKLPRERDLLVRRDARIHRDHQARAPAIKLLHRLPRQAVALAQAVRDIIFARSALAA